MYLKYYMNKLGHSNLPDFIVKYLKTPSLVRLKNIGYFCGMDYASKDIYDFSEYISRYDHSLTVFLIVYKLTNDRIKALAGLFHDIATPCFSHVVDYMNNDYEKQESTEEYTEYILKSDEYLCECLKEDAIDIEDIINFKKYTVVDNNRPKLCADRIDGVILTGIGWTKNISETDIYKIVDSMRIYKNEDNEDEIGFSSLEIAKKVLEINKSIDINCHSIEDNYMMMLLAKITKIAIDKEYVVYEDLYIYDEKSLFDLLKLQDDMELQKLIYEFENKQKCDIMKLELPNIKVRNLNPIVDGSRIV